MRHISLATLMSALSFCTIVGSATVSADEPVTLIGTIVKWRYPDAELTRSQMSDAATIDAAGNRTVPSCILKTTMITRDSVDEVLAFYRGLLSRGPAEDRKLGVDSNIGQSVVFSDESDGRPFAFHTIVVNSEKCSTTLIITRGEDEDHTHILWKQYLKFDIGG